MILIGLGANLPSTAFGSPKDTLEAALGMLKDEGISLECRSRWYSSPPVPPSDQAWYVNGVASVSSDLPPKPLLQALHRIEKHLGRVRRTRWESRIVDLDLLAYGNKVTGTENNGVTVPHPRLHERLFVLLPLADISTTWRHPVLGLTVADMIANLSKDARILPIVL